MATLQVKTTLILTLRGFSVQESLLKVLQVFARYAVYSSPHCLSWSCHKFLQIDLGAHGLWVDVCSHGISCLHCGLMTSTKPGDWGGVYCLGGSIAGNEVRIRHKYQTMRFCEVEIIGKEIG